MSNYELRDVLTDMVDACRSLLESHRKSHPKARILGFNCGEGYINPEEYVLKLGHDYQPAALNGLEYARVLEAILIARKRGCAFEPKDCFNNAQRLVMASPGLLKYAEGFVRSVMPIHHAWATINGKVVDLTLRWGMFGRGAQKALVPDAFTRIKMDDRIYGIWYDSAAYLGCDFDRIDVAKHILRDDVDASMINTVERLTGKVV